MTDTTQIGIWPQHPRRVPTMTEPKKRGRKSLPEADRIAGRLASKAKFKNVTLDADLSDALNEVADKLATKLGFRPTLSQAVRHLITREREKS